MNIRFLVMDVDGTLTDGKIYMGQTGELLKTFDIKDGCGIAVLLPKMNIEPVIITARESEIVNNRSKELGIKLIVQNSKDKLSSLNQIIASYNCENGTSYGLENCAYMGDDVVDLPIMAAIKKAGGITVCPNDAINDVKKGCSFICTKNAGNGAVREFIEWLNEPREESDLKEKVKQALSYLYSLDTANLCEGKTEVNSDFYYTVQRYNTKEVSECSFESHKKYVDIQIMIEGSEIMDLADISRMSMKQEYNSDSDFMLWNEPERFTRTTLRQGDYIVIYPETAHRGAINLGLEERVLKIVGKVRINK